MIARQRRNDGDANLESGCSSNSWVGCDKLGSDILLEGGGDWAFVAGSLTVSQIKDTAAGSDLFGI